MTKKSLDSRFRGNDILFMAISNPCNNTGLIRKLLRSIMPNDKPI
ncbi:hypothetical protein [Rickettsia endosymbiont of Orchestes rusci]